MADLDSDREYFLDLLRTSILNCINDLDGNPDRDFSSFRVDSLYHTVLRFVELFEVDETVIDLISDARELLTVDYIDTLPTTFTTSCPTYFTGSPGPPKYQLTEEILRFLFDKGFTVKDTATLLGVSKRTVERRMTEYGLQISNCYSTIDDVELEATIRNFVNDFPNIGYKRMSGLLLSRGLRIQQTKIREMMRRVDPRGTLYRAISLRAVHRRRYHVAGPQSLWHVDGNHKLIRYY